VVFDLTDGSGCGKNASVVRPHRIATIPRRVQGKLAKTLRRDCVALTLQELVAADLLGIAGGDARLHRAAAEAATARVETRQSEAQYTEVDRSSDST
jgi:hypothetical protein